MIRSRFRSGGIVLVLVVVLVLDPWDLGALFGAEASPRIEHDDEHEHDSPNFGI